MLPAAVQKYIDQELTFPDGFFIAAKAALRMVQKKQGADGFIAIYTFHRKYFKTLSKKESDEYTTSLLNDMGINL